MVYNLDMINNQKGMEQGEVSLLFAFRLSEVSLLFAFRLSEVSLLFAFCFLSFRS